MKKFINNFFSIIAFASILHGCGATYDVDLNGSVQDEGGRSMSYITGTICYSIATQDGQTLPETCHNRLVTTDKDGAFNVIISQKDIYSKPVSVHAYFVLNKGTVEEIRIPSNVKSLAFEDMPYVHSLPGETYQAIVKNNSVTIVFREKSLHDNQGNAIQKKTRKKSRKQLSDPEQDSLSPSRPE